MISEFTYEQAKDVIEARELDTIRVVGKNEPITVYEVLERKNMLKGEKAELVEKYNQGLSLYKERRYSEAAQMFEAVLEIDPFDGPSLTYVDRCQKFVDAPPAVA